MHVVIYEGPGATPFDARRLCEVLTALLDAGYAVSRVRCLCEVGADGQRHVAFVGRFHPQTMAQLNAADAPQRFCALDAGDHNAGAVLEMVRLAAERLGAARPDRWIPWFPVIDYDLCKGCRQCLGFCLFGVFAFEGERIEVQRPANCKTYCPACARVCANGAIIFPKYKGGPINGDQVDPAAWKSETVKVDLRALTQGDVYAALRRRGGARRPQEAPAAACDCLERLRTRLDIPPEVIAQLRGGTDSPDRASTEAGNAGQST
jgi:NAD-dependent dihydropyrimidine dehydrogenase PreA subunit